MRDTGSDKNLPRNKNKPTVLDANPNDPTITTSFGLDISVKRINTKEFRGAQGCTPFVLKKRSIASKKIEKHKASRKTPLIRAARISARCQP